MGRIDGVRGGGSGGDPVVAPGAGRGEGVGIAATTAGRQSVGDAKWAWWQNSCSAGRTGLSWARRLMRHSRDPCSSRGPCRMVLPALSRIVTQKRVKMAVHSASQRVPMLRRLLVKAGMI